VHVDAASWIGHDGSKAVVAAGRIETKRAPNAAGRRVVVDARDNGELADVEVPMKPEVVSLPTVVGEGTESPRSPPAHTRQSRERGEHGGGTIEGLKHRPPRRVLEPAIWIPSEGGHVISALDALFDGLRVASPCLPGETLERVVVE